jgi:hypothetical protein
MSDGNVSAVGTAPRGYGLVKAMAKSMGLRLVTDLIVLARKNDPFFAGAPADVRMAEWFARIWNALGPGQRHLRRVHYQLISVLSPPPLPDGTPYVNTTLCWEKLGTASKWARHLGLVDPSSFRDHRNPRPHCLAHHGREVPSPALDVPDVAGWWLPSIRSDLAAGLEFPLPQPAVSGYDYGDGLQPCLIEVWVEKSTMDDVLLPLCREYGANYVTSVGFQSITGAVNLLEQRVATLPHDIPVRLFYVSDFDPAGDGMPVAVARQIEFYIDRYCPGSDIKLTPLALTKEQVVAYQLPRTPIRDTDTRRKHFEDRYGEGAVELDALEAVHPGELERTVREAFAPYRDATLRDRLAEAEAREAAAEAWDAAMAPYRERREALHAEAAQILSWYRPALEHLNDVLQKKLEGVRQRLTDLRDEIQAEAERFRVVPHAVQESDSSGGGQRDSDNQPSGASPAAVPHAVQPAGPAAVDLPERPEAEIDPPDEDDWLFDSGRDYMEQLAVYKARQGNAEADGVGPG